MNTFSPESLALLRVLIETKEPEVIMAAIAFIVSSVVTFFLAVFGWVFGAMTLLSAFSFFVVGSVATAVLAVGVITLCAFGKSDSQDVSFT